MPSKTRHGLLISFVVVSLIIVSFHASYADTTNYVYDELNRLIRVEYADGTKIVYTYDQSGNRSHVYVGEYSLTVNAVGSGTVTKNPDQPIYNAGTSVTLTAVNGSQTFSEWSGDQTGNINPSTILMNGNKSVTARNKHRGVRPQHETRWRTTRGRSVEAAEDWYTESFCLELKPWKVNVSYCSC